MTIMDENPFGSVPAAPQDAMFGLSAAYRADTSHQKVDLGVGAYRDNNAKPWVLPVVRKADKVLSSLPELSHEYLPIAGLPEYLEASQKLVFGESSNIIKEKRVATVQTLSGTGALHLGALFLAKFLPESMAKKVYVSDPPYVNHIPILQHAALSTGSYSYYSRDTKGLQFDRFMDDLSAIPSGSIVLLHACGHNPTGVDPSRTQWNNISSLMKARALTPFFDIAYQGFVSGDPDSDAWAIRHFLDQGFGTMLVAQSYAKNFGLYGERAGCLHVVAPTANLANRASGQLQRLQRVEISTPPAYGARVVSAILNSPELLQEWTNDLQVMSGRILKMRRLLREKLEELQGAGSWDHVTNHAGMFCFTGLDVDQVRSLREGFHIYLTADGRISVSGLNMTNVDYVARSIVAVMNRAKL